MKFQREFLLLAANMLRCRFELLHGRSCTRVAWIHYSGELSDILCYVGYADHKGEMRLLCEEMR